MTGNLNRYEHGFGLIEICLVVHFPYATTSDVWKCLKGANDNPACCGKLREMMMVVVVKYETSERLPSHPSRVRLGAEMQYLLHLPRHLSS